MTGTVTIASVRAHGVRQLLVYCLGKREGDWPCHHQGTLPIDRFQAEEVLSDIERRCRCTVSGWRAAKRSVGATLDAIRRDVAPTRPANSCVSARTKFAQSLAFKAWQLLVTLSLRSENGWLPLEHVGAWRVGDHFVPGLRGGHARRRH